MNGPLKGLRALELGASESAGIAAMLLSDFGMEVIRLDDPDAAQVCSNEDGVTFGCPSTSERICDRGKKRVFLDPKRAEQREVFLRLLETCDVVLDGLLPGSLDEIGLDDETLRRRFPDLVCVSVSGFGTSGPCADQPWSEATIQAESGFMSTTGIEGGEPVRSGGDIASYLGGLMACIAALAALIGRAGQGSGRLVDVSMMDAILFGLENQFSLYLRTGIVPRPKGNNYALSAPVGNFPCGDGKEIMISVATEAQWKAFAEAVHREEWLEKPEYVNVSRRIENYKQLGRDVTEAFSAYTRDELMAALQSRACIYGCINDFPAVVAHPQVAARDMLMEVTDALGESFTTASNPILRGGLPASARQIHRSGNDTSEVLTGLDEQIK